jgi:hypothetical protein
MYYEVGSKATIFTNKIFAAHYAASKNLSIEDIHFNMYDSAFDRCDWSRDPALSWDQLLDIRARQIAAKNKPIVLYFSGGTDSYTIYKVFERNRIPLTAIYLRKRPDHVKKTYDRVHELFSAGLYDPSIQIIIDDDFKKSLLAAYKSQDWLWNMDCKQHFGILAPDRYSEKYISSVLGRDDFISVVGYEKPRLKITQDAVYSYQDDDNYNKLMSLPGIDYFYISSDLPELHVKQSYMLLNYIKSKSQPGALPEDLLSWNDIHLGWFDWLGYSIDACGRFDDLNLSPRQHLGNFMSAMTIPMSGKFNGSEIRGRPAKWFQDLYKTNPDIFKNYTDGYMSVLTDPAGKFLLEDPRNVFNFKHYNSKMYQMTF